MTDDANNERISSTENKSNGQIFDELTSLQNVPNYDLPDFEGKFGGAGPEGLDTAGPDTPSLADFRRGTKSDVNSRLLADDARFIQGKNQSNDSEGDQHHTNEVAVGNFSSLPLDMSRTLLVENQSSWLDFQNSTSNFTAPGDAAVENIEQSTQLFSLVSQSDSDAASDDLVIFNSARSSDALTPAASQVPSATTELDNTAEQVSSHILQVSR